MGEAVLMMELPKRHSNRGELGVQSLRENTQLQEAAGYPPERPASREACALEFIRVHLNAPEQSENLRSERPVQTCKLGPYPGVP